MWLSVYKRCVSCSITVTFDCDACHTYGRKNAPSQKKRKYFLSFASICQRKLLNLSVDLVQASAMVY